MSPEADIADAQQRYLAARAKCVAAYPKSLVLQSDPIIIVDGIREDQAPGTAESLAGYAGTNPAPSGLACRFEARPQLFKIIDFAIEDEPYRAVFIGHRLAAGVAYVNYSQPVMSQSDAVGNFRRAEALDESAVGTAVAAGGNHRAHSGASPLDWPTA